MNITFTSNFVAIYRARNVYQQHMALHYSKIHGQTYIARNVYQQHMALHYSKIQGQTTRKQSKEKQVQM